MFIIYLQQSLWFRSTWNSFPPHFYDYPIIHSIILFVANMLKFWFNLCIKTDPKYSNGCALWHGDKLCHIVTENRTNPESDIDIRPHFFPPEVISVQGFGDKLNSPEWLGGEWRGLQGKFILNKFCSIQANQMLAGTSEKLDHTCQSTDT